MFGRVEKGSVVLWRARHFWAGGLSPSILHSWLPMWSQTRAAPLSCPLPTEHTGFGSLGWKWRALAWKGCSWGACGLVWVFSNKFLAALLEEESFHISRDERVCCFTNLASAQHPWNVTLNMLDYHCQVDHQWKSLFIHSLCSSFFLLFLFAIPFLFSFRVRCQRFLGAHRTFFVVKGEVCIIFWLLIAYLYVTLKLLNPFCI